MQHTNQAGLDLIKSFEKLVLRAYQVKYPGKTDVWTIGYGSTEGVHPGMVITEEQALEMLQNDLITAEEAVAKFITVALNDNEFSALVSFTFNCGAGNLQTSTLRKLLNAGNRKGAADQFLVWDKVGGQAVDGLDRRRKAERALFLKTP